MTDKESKGVIKILKEILSLIIAHYIAVVITIAVGGIITFIISRKTNYTSLEIILMILIFLIVIGVIIFFIYRKTNKRLPIFRALDYDFHMLSCNA